MDGFGGMRRSPKIHLEQPFSTEWNQDRTSKNNSSNPNKNNKYQANLKLENAVIVQVQ
jgi:hypothetical protein